MPTCDEHIDVGENILYHEQGPAPVDIILIQVLHILLSSCSPFFYVFNVILPYSFIVSQKSVGDNKKATDRVT